MIKNILLILLLATMVPLPVSAQGEYEFLNPKITSVYRSLVCSGWEGQECRAVFLIQGKHFVNTNGQRAVRVGDEWADILRWEDSIVVATSSEKNLDKTPAVTIDTTIRTPHISSNDPVLDEMFSDSVEVAIKSIRMTEDGDRYIVAGPKYGDPERVYYRDSYWTSGMVMLIEPAVVRDQIMLLARGVEPNGGVPSAIPVDESDTKIPLWLDHVDSGPYFVMMVYDYISWTGDDSILAERVNGRTILETMEDIVTYLSLKDTNGNFLPEKPKDSLQDWLDSIPRSGEVLYDEILYYRALRNLFEMSEIAGKFRNAKTLHRQSMLVRFMINKQFWNDEGGYYYESCFEGTCVDRVTNESSLAILYDVIDPNNRDRFFQSLRILESSYNDEIPNGDWGVLNAWPLYDGFTPYDYQNGTDWPFLDAMNAGARLKYDNDDWYYPLTRWWSYNEEKDEPKLLPEYLSPVDEDAGELQAWSVAPAVSFVRYGLGINPDINGAYTLKTSSFTDVTMEDIAIGGYRISISVEGKE